ncbi:hypothetical protein [uncultured Amaricoccus sp.]|uniref:hypothetical protein n=1 Tax=uncultured Amaricoccus sp. TaxID=339341 RepID=UPI0026114962|nr:hypothetical protein [uncultured Amaricoccus sp.]
MRHPSPLSVGAERHRLGARPARALGGAGDGRAAAQFELKREVAPVPSPPAGLPRIGSVVLLAGVRRLR